jgi:N6-L-threonylcarbamoyladenine synthase
MLILGIETSCDDTAAAVVRDGREILSNVIASQVDVHAVFGGVVPEIAAREHLTQINGCVDAALSQAGIDFIGLSAIAVTQGPGLVGAVLIGVSTAKALAYALGIPLIGEHHRKGHMLAGLLHEKVTDCAQVQNIEPPFLSLVVSGGHTQIADVRSYSTIDILGRTRDDAAGEAFDKVARVLGLGYPGGPAVDALAYEGDPEKIAFPRVMLEAGSFDFSFSGIKTAVLNFCNSEKQAGRDINVADVAAGFTAAVVDVITDKTRAALKKTGRKTLMLGGGVAANSHLRACLGKMCKEEEVTFIVPPKDLCTDNAAMIACAGYYEYKEGKASGLDIDAMARMDLE